MAIYLEDLLTQIPDDTEERVERARKKWNNTIRELLRKETGLLLNRPKKPGIGTNETVAIPVNLVPGLPDVLQEIKFEEDTWLIAQVSPFRADLERVAASGPGIQRMLRLFSDNPQAASVLQGRHQHFPPTLELTRELLRRLDTSDPVKKILAVNQDVLGTYTYQIHPPEYRHDYYQRQFFYTDPLQGHIELYWAIIGLIAGMLGVAIEELTVVVLIHELAHAYTHLGADIDGDRWGSKDFHAAERGLKEGLAQYYTAVVCQRLNSQIPGAFVAYETLLKRQPPDYHTHESWLQEAKPEEVRFAMLESRRQASSTVADFEQRLEETGRILRRSSND